MIRTKLQAAADAATLATVSIQSPVVATAKNMTGNGTVSGGSTYATNFFNANAPAGYTGVTPTVQPLQKPERVSMPRLPFRLRFPPTLWESVGFKNITITGTSTASYKFPTYINFYLMLDVSGSMSFPSTTAEQARLMAVNPDNLTGSMGYPAAASSPAILPRRVPASNHLFLDGKSGKDQSRP